MTENPSSIGPFDHLRIEHAPNEIAVVTFDRAPVNAIDHVMYREIAAAFGQLGAPSSRVRAIIVTGHGRHFCAGNDLFELTQINAENANERLRGLRQVLWSVSDCNLPVIAAVHGAVVGAGVGIAASSDAIVATADARFSIPELAVGLVGGASHMRRLAPTLAVRRMALTGEPVDAAVLHRWGSIDSIVHRDDLIPTAINLAETMLKHPPEMLAAAKQAMRVTEYADLKAGYEHEHVHAIDMIERRAHQGTTS